jgi:hypothetical protein
MRIVASLIVVPASVVADTWVIAMGVSKGSCAELDPKKKPTTTVETQTLRKKERMIKFLPYEYSDSTAQESYFTRKTKLAQGEITIGNIGDPH